MKYFMNAALPAQLSLEEFKHVMEALGLRWVQHIPKAEMQLHEEIWELPGDRGIVRYIFDHYVNVPSVRAGSDIRYEPGKILLDLDAHLPFLHYGKLGRMAQSTSLAERKYALRAFASIIKNFDWEVVDALRAVLKEPDPDMRMLGMVCIARYPYNLFADDLEELAKTEPVAVNKAEALRLAQDLREGGKKSQF